MRLLTLTLAFLVGANGLTPPMSPLTTRARPPVMQLSPKAPLLGAWTGRSTAAQEHALRWPPQSLSA